MRLNTRNPNAILAVTAFAAFLATFNETYLNIAFAPIMSDLGVEVFTVQWLATAYMLGAAVMIPVSAFLYRSVPTRALFRATLGFLIAGSVVGALAPSFPLLLAGRILQAIGTGLLIPVGMNITLEVAPREKIGAYMGVIGAMTTLGPSISVITAGALLSFANWHLLLWIFAALSLLCFAFGSFLLGDIASLSRPRLDLPSVALIGAALAGILYGLSTAFSGGALPALVSALAGAACLYLFVRRQKRLAEPLIDLGLLSIRPFAMGVAINMISLVVIFAMNIVLPIYMQGALGASSLASSLTLFPAIFASCIAAPIVGRIYDRRGAKVLLPLGFCLIALFSAALSVAAGHAPLSILALLYVPVIVGSAFVIGPVQGFALSRLEPRLYPHGVTLMSTGFQIAGCIGASLFTGVYAAAISAGLRGGSSAGAAARSGFLLAGLLATAFALAGLALAVAIGRSRAAVPAEEGSEDAA
jgi:DHA2 family lincomycin resistance protein-like MFS transporter